MATKRSSHFSAAPGSVSKEDITPYPEFVANLKVSGGQTGTPKLPPADLGKKHLKEKAC